MSSISSGSRGGGLVTAYVSNTFTAASGFSYLTNTTSAGFTGTLPTGSTGAQVQFTDDAATWATNNLVIAPATGQVIQGLPANDTISCNISGAFVLLSWDSTNSYWVVSGSGFQSTAAATATTPGVVSTTAQTFGGTKTLPSGITLGGSATQGVLNSFIDWTSYSPVVMVGATVVSRTIQYAKYCQVGKVVTVSLEVDLTSFNAGSGNLTVSMPITRGTGNPDFATGAVSVVNGFRSLALAQWSNNSTLTLYIPTSTTNQTLITATAANFSATGEICISITYEAASN